MCASPKKKRRKQCGYNTYETACFSGSPVCGCDRQSRAVRCSGTIGEIIGPTGPINAEMSAARAAGKLDLRAETRRARRDGIYWISAREALCFYQTRGELIMWRFLFDGSTRVSTDDCFVEEGARHLSGCEVDSD